jgi:hypothetical protein
MSTETIFDRLKEKPFKPFRLRVSDGEHYDIWHPEMLKLMWQRIILFFYDKEEGPGNEYMFAERSVTISPLHVTSIEDLSEKQRGSRRKVS